MNLAELRTRHSRLIYRGFSWKLLGSNLHITADFLLEPSIVFQPLLIIQGVGKERVEQIGTSKLDLLAFHLGLAELPSYWKAACPAEIVVEAGPLTEKQIKWWRKLIIKGLGEFFYLNKIDFTQDNFLKIRSVSEKIIPTVPSSSAMAFVKTSASPTVFEGTPILTNTETATDKPTFHCKDILDPEEIICTPKKTDLPECLVPIGGGKDSALTISLLQQHDLPFSVLLLGPHSPAANEIAKKSKATEIIRARRQIDPKLLELNRAGYLNGHTPFSAYLAFLSSLVAQLFRKDRVLLSNESSANEGNVLFHSQTINHQYSKTLEFETAFRQYASEYLATPEYLSWLRPLNELQIARLFSQFSKYRPIFRSCNVGQQKNIWCGHCPKCLFVYSMLAPFVDQAILSKEIFDHNLLEDQDNLQFATELLGFSKQKPFECVGTYEEVQAAFYLIINQYYRSGQQIPSVVAGVFDRLSNNLDGWQRRVQKLLSGWQPHHHLDEKLEHILRSEVISNQLRGQFSDKTIAILGLAREGLSTYSFIRQYLPKTKIVLLDQKTTDELFESEEEKKLLEKIMEDDKTDLLLAEEHQKFLKEQTNNHTVLFKAPGIPKSIALIQTALKRGAQLHSQTQLFFELCPARIIGVTGTKGKSTTSSLIHHLLKETGRKSVLVGNIGSPALQSLIKIDSETEVVYELSCHQLDSIKQSPEIAVVQRITSEHLDYYATTQEYVAAKSAITKHQSKNDYVIYCSDFEGATKSIVDLSPGIKLPFSLENPTEEQKSVDLSGSKLPGKHNLYNLAPAVKIGQLLGIPDAEISHVLSSFSGLPHRLEYVATIRQVDYFNDSLATMPDATVRAIESFTGRPITLIAGGYDRHQDFMELVETISNSTVRTIVLFPTTGARLKEELKNNQPKTNQHRKKAILPAIFDANSMKEAVEIAFRETQPGGVVLMSPASASFGMFKDYAQRGHVFKRLVKDIQEDINGSSEK
ncbi:MAG: UDP-N-acetylmuramoyl-L-alanine--D-glutamate ligase [Patescibacteria group bacterium]